MKTLLYAQDNNFNKSADFKLDGILGSCYLFCAAWDDKFKDGCKKYPHPDDNVVFGMQRAGVIKANYTEQDCLDIERFAKIEPIKNGEIVEINGAQYRTRILGNYSDAARFDLVNGG